MNAKLRMIDLFAGAGGLSLGLKQAGFSLVFANEIDKVCSETLQFNHNLNDNQIFIGDIKELNKKIINNEILFKDIDLVSGGPPCQGFSMSNRQRIIDDSRNSLYKDYIEFIKHVKPKFFLMENVRGMENKISEILDDFNILLEGEYKTGYLVLNSKNYGVPQSRERLFVIGNKVGVNPQDIFDSIKQNTCETFVLEDAIADLPVLKPKRIKNNNTIENDECGYTEREYQYNNTKFQTYINNGRTIDKLYNHKNRYNNDRDIDIYTLLPQGENSLHPSIEHIMPYKSRNHIFKDKYYKLNYREISKTITSHMKYDCNMYIHPTQSRGLSPREAARIQTFPDDYIFKGSQN